MAIPILNYWPKEPRSWLRTTAIPILRVSAVTIAIWFALAWAVRPFLYSPQGLYPIDWTESQLIRDRYPILLIAPEWFAEPLPRWIFFETLARLGLVVVGILVFYLVIHFLAQRRKAMGVPNNPGES